MPKTDQGVTKDRYMLIPRTAIFVRRGDEYLLIKGAPTKRLWAGKYNGVGGHVERGENIHFSAQRELLEETGLLADLWLCGTVIVDAGDASAGICLFMFCGENVQGEVKAGAEGAIEWVKKDAILHLPVVEDLPVLLDRIHQMQRGDPPFSARSYYDENDKLIVVFTSTSTSSS
ncbi:NUDIX domain-containing protein [Candidatus Villigracilis saccharophilus]|uniref:NUDIX hydrolase n=1 Tax=Candidatus Villigracilis saccharophilus TaxID=3140684 RepID=UPI00313626CF|nr:NUDIX domain-containing protein [Anaerolineales bacterium]